MDGNIFKIIWHDGEIVSTHFSLKSTIKIIGFFSISSLYYETSHNGDRAIFVVFMVRMIESAIYCSNAEIIM